MLCSDCKKNNAVVFVNKKDNEGKNTLEGYCYDCAKKRGINPIDSLMKQANLTEDDLNNMTQQFESMFKDMSDNMNFADIQEESEDSYNPENEGAMQFGAIPLGSIFSNMFGASNEGGSNSSDANSNSKKKVKVDKKNNKNNYCNWFSNRSTLRGKFMRTNIITCDTKNSS